jgi:hypothetical protein
MGDYAGVLRSELMDGNGQFMIKCRNCNNCCRDGFRLSESYPEDREYTEIEEGKKKVRTVLEQLAVCLKTTSSVLRLPSYFRLSSTDRKRFTDRYFTIAGGDSIGWPWKKYGVDVIQTICKAIGRDPPSITGPHLVQLNCIDVFLFGFVAVYSRTAAAAGTQCSTKYYQHR